MHSVRGIRTSNWTTVVFRISNILNTDPVTYQLTDNLNKQILECFYEKEI